MKNLRNLALTGLLISGLVSNQVIQAGFLSDHKETIAAAVAGSVIGSLAVTSLGYALSKSIKKEISPETKKAILLEELQEALLAVQKEIRANQEFFRQQLAEHEVSTNITQEKHKSSAQDDVTTNKHHDSSDRDAKNLLIMGGIGVLAMLCVLVVPADYLPQF
jgi:hypothetical protein